MGRKNYIPGSDKTDKAIASYETLNFASGVIKGTPASKIPNDSLADAYDVVVHPDEIIGRGAHGGGSTLYTSVKFPALDNRTGYTASKSNGLVESFTGDWSQVCAQLGSETRIYSLAVYNGRLYAGTNPNGLLYRLNTAGTAWEQVCAQLNSQTYILSLAVYDGRLYGGTYPDGLLFRLNAAGNAWEQVCAQLNGQTRILDLVVYNGRLYGSTADDGCLFRLNAAGNAWEQVCAQLNGQVRVNGLAVYNGRLYGGTALGGRLFRLNAAGNAWEQVCSQLGSQTYIVSLAVYNGRLYGGTYPHGMLYRLNAAGNAWEQVCAQLDAQTDIIWNLTIYNERLYGSTGSEGRLFRLNVAGNAWEQVCDQLDSQTDIYSLAVYDNTLYGGTYPNGNLFEPEGNFLSTDVYNFFVFPGSPDKHYQITEYLNSALVRVHDISTEHFETLNCYLRGKTNLAAWHNILREWIFMWGTQIYVADTSISSLTRCRVISVGDEPADGFSTYDDFDGLSGLIFNSNGIFRIDFNLDPPVVYKINTPTPENTILDVNKDETSKYNYRYLYSAMRLSDDEFEADRLTPKRIELETGTNKWEANTYKDYADVYTEKPIGIYYDVGWGAPTIESDVQGILTCGTLVSPYDNVGGWQDLTQNGSFKININNIGTNEVIVDFSNVTNMVEVASVIQAALRDFFPEATCEFDTDHFVVKSAIEIGLSSNDYIEYMTDGTASNATNVAGHLKGKSGDASSKNTENVKEPKVIGPLYVPKILSTSPQEYQQHFTHFPIYRTRDLLGRYKIGDEADQLNNPNDFIWTFDLRTCAAFWGCFHKPGSYLYYITDDSGSEFQDEDVGCVLEAENGYRFEIEEISDSAHRTVRLNAITSPGASYNYDFMAAAIGNGRVFRASQSGYTVTRTHGDIFSIDDIGKPIKWTDRYSVGPDYFSADPIWDYITGYISANQVTVSTSQTRSSTGMTMEPIYRYYHDCTDDKTLETRLTRLRLKQRFWQPLPSSNVGKVIPGTILVADEEELSYGQTPDTHEYLHGFHDVGYQITKVVKDTIKAMWLFQDVLVIWTTSKTWRWPTGSYQYIENPFTRAAIFQITGLEIADSDKGCYDEGSIEPIGDGNIMLLTFESGQIGWRAYNGYQYGPDVLEILGKQRIPEIQDLVKSIEAFYDGNAGMLLFGRT